MHFREVSPPPPDKIRLFFTEDVRIILKAAESQWAAACAIPAQKDSDVTDAAIKFSSF
jgi:hypothetical protein